MSWARWFALKVKSRHEKYVDSALHHKGYDHFLPLYQHCFDVGGRFYKSELPLFPTYTFCQFDPGNKLPILITPGVVSIVGFGQGPVAVDEQELESVRSLAGAGVNTIPCSYVQAGDKVCIEG